VNRGVEFGGSCGRVERRFQGLHRTITNNHSPYSLKEQEQILATLIKLG